MTLNGVVALILLFSPNSIALPTNYVTLVEHELIMSTKILSPSSSLLLLAKTSHPAVRPLCDS